MHFTMTSKYLKRMTTRPDNIWKLAFKNLLPNFVKFLFRTHYDKVDWTKEVHFLDKELQTLHVNSRPQDRIADILVMLHLKDGSTLYVFLHIEVQGYTDKTFVLRVHQMRYRIEDKYGSSPAMLSIFTDDDPDFHPKEYIVETWGSGNKTFFNTYKVMENHPSTYLDPNSIVSLIMETVYYSTQIKKHSDDDIMNLFIPIVKKLLSKGFSKEYVHLVLSFIKMHIKFGNSENYTIFEEKLVNMEQYEEVMDLETFFNTDRIKEEAKEAQKQLQEAQMQLQEAKTRLKEAENQVQQRERQEKERERQEKERSLLLMLSQGMSIDLICKVLEVTKEEIESIQEKYKDNNPIDKFLNGQTKN